MKHFIITDHIASLNKKKTNDERQESENTAITIHRFTDGENMYITYSTLLLIINNSMEWCKIWTKIYQYKIESEQKKKKQKTDAEWKTPNAHYFFSLMWKQNIFIKIK